MELEDNFLTAPQDYLVVIKTTNSEINLVGLLLPAIQAIDKKYPDLNDGN